MADNAIQMVFISRKFFLSIAINATAFNVFLNSVNFFSEQNNVVGI